MRLYLSLTMLAAGAGLLEAATTAHGGGAGASIRKGGEFRIAFFGNTGKIDPAVLDETPSPATLALLDTTCARLMAYPDKPPPAGYRLVPEVARGNPRISNRGKTYTFTLRPRLRFSDGTLVRPDAFAWGITRMLKLQGLFAGLFDDIVGAEQVKQGKADVVTGIDTRGNRLVITLTRSAPSFPARLTNVCAVPPGLPANPEGEATFHAAGPYYVAKHVRGRRILLRRNRFYRGPRPQRVDRFVAVGGVSSFGVVLDRIQSGRTDWAWVPPEFYFEPRRRLAARYGVNRSRFWVRPGLTLVHYPLNTRRALFRDNPRLRRAVNYAVNRSAVRRELVGRPRAARLTDQYLPPGLPGFKDARIYPLRHPNLKKARALARGHRRSGRAVLYTPDVPTFIGAAQIIKRNLARIKLDVKVMKIPGGDYFPRLLENPDEPWDIAFGVWAPDHLDPYTYLNELFDPRFIGVGNLSHFDAPYYNRRLRHAATLRGKARYSEYGKLDVHLARRAAPTIAFYYVNEPTLVSKRVDPRCIVLRPTLDLAAVCLKR